MLTASETAVWQRQLDNLDIYASTQDWTIVVRDKVEDYADDSVRSVFIKRRLNKETQTYITLHELGHLVLFKQKDYGLRFASMCNARARKAYGTLVYKVGRVEEELAAWEEGKKIADILGIPLNEKRYYRLRAHNIGTYLLWAQRRQIDREYTLKEDNNATNHN
jgi:hypothetical protein